MPAVYLLQLKELTLGIVKPNEFIRGDRKNNDYILTSDKQQLSLLSQSHKHFQYIDIHDVE